MFLNMVFFKDISKDKKYGLKNVICTEISYRVARSVGPEE